MQLYKFREGTPISAHKDRASATRKCCAATYVIHEGRFIQAHEALGDFRRSDSWRYLSETTKAQVWFFLNDARMYTFTASADELFSSSMEDSWRGLQSKIWHWRAKLYYGRDIVQVKIHLEELLQQSTNTGDLYNCRDALDGPAKVAFYRGGLSKAMGTIQKIIEMFDGKDPENLLWSTVWKAVVASHQGEYDLARELIHKAFEPFEFLALRSALVFLHRSYCSSQVELTAGEYDKAESHFNATIEGCDIQGNLYFNF